MAKILPFELWQSNKTKTSRYITCKTKYDEEMCLVIGQLAGECMGCLGKFPSIFEHMKCLSCQQRGDMPLQSSLMCMLATSIEIHQDKS